MLKSGVRISDLDPNSNLSTLKAEPSEHNHQHPQQHRTPKKEPKIKRSRASNTTESEKQSSEAGTDLSYLSKLQSSLFFEPGKKFDRIMDKDEEAKGSELLSSSHKITRREDPLIKQKKKRREQKVG